MMFTLMWLIISLCMVRLLYVGVRERNYGYIFCALVILMWAVFQTASYAGFVSQDMVVDRIDTFPKMF